VSIGREATEASSEAVILAHVQEDHTLARDLAAFLELGCDVRCDPQAGLLNSGESLVDLAEQCTEHLILLLSKDSWPVKLPRERWDPVLLGRPLACVLVNPCPYPQLLRRGVFFDVHDRNAWRGLKRWLWQQRAAPNISPHLEWSADLEELYAALADKPGVLTAASADLAIRFARQAAGEFESVVWVPCHGRTLVEATGDLGHQLGFTLDGEEARNQEQLHQFLAAGRYLVVLDAPEDALRDALTGGGRTSTLVTRESVKILETPRTFEYGRELVKQKRLAEAYVLFYALMDEEGMTGICAQELAGICEHWGRHGEAERLRRFDPAPGRQMGLFDFD
jgi:hypothetical protein